MKEKTKFKATIMTMISAIFNTVIVSILNLVYNNLVIRYYGSSFNGLISTLTQFVSLFTIIEGGFSIAAVVSSYDSIVKEDYEKLNNILYTIRKYLRKVSFVFSIVALLGGLFYIQFIDSPLTLIETISMLIITIVTTTISLGILPCYTIVMSGYNSGYVTSFIATVSKALTWAISIYFILNKINIVLVYIFNLINILLNILCLKVFLKRYYPYITYNGKYDKNLIKGTKDVLFQKIANTIFSSTDLILISAGISLAMASVYNLYNQIFSAIFNFLASIVESPFNSFGQLFSDGEDEKIVKNFNIFKKSIQLISTIFLSITGMSILGFITVYTKGVNDIDYVIPTLVVLFYLQYYLQLNNRPYGLLLNVSGNFHMQNYQCGLAAIVNLILSIIFMQFIGVKGIILGSIIGTVIILIMNIYQCYKYVIKGSFAYDLIWQLINCLVGIVLIILSILTSFNYSNYFIWIIGAIINSLISIGTICIINVLLDKKMTLSAISFLTEKIKSKFKK